MKIIHVYDGHERSHQGRGSLPRIVWNVASRTADRGHDVAVIERQWSGLPRFATHDGVYFRRLPLRVGSDEPWEEVPYEMVGSASGVGKLLVDRTDFALRTLRVLGGIDYDVLHVYLPFAANVLVTVAPRLRKRLVFTAQLGELRLNSLTETSTSEDFDAPAVLRRFSPDVYLAKRASHTTVLNANVKRIFAEQGVPTERLTHVPNGVDVEHSGGVNTAARERIARTYDLRDERVVLFVGTVMPRKGVLELVRAVAAVVHEHGLDDVRLVVAGEADLDERYTDSVRSLISELGIDEHVVFTGYLTDRDLLPLYERSDVFALPSFEEGFGMVVSEAMAMGTPAIGSNISGIDQQIEDGVSGILVEPGDPARLAEAIVELLDDPAKRNEMGDRARQRARRFSWETVVDDYVGVYKRL